MNFQLVNSIHAAKVHREIIDELHTKNIVHPGKSIEEIVNYIEDKVKENQLNSIENSTKLNRKSIGFNRRSIRFNGNSIEIN